MVTLSLKDFIFSSKSNWPYLYNLYFFCHFLSYKLDILHLEYWFRVRMARQWIWFSRICKLDIETGKWKYNLCATNFPCDWFTGKCTCYFCLWSWHNPDKTCISICFLTSLEIHTCPITAKEKCFSSLPWLQKFTVKITGCGTSLIVFFV
jgi:hypothetical protein